MIKLRDGFKSPPPAMLLAGAFVGTLCRWLGPDKIREVRLRNSKETDHDVCHSHDFCDANMAMDAAMSECGIDTDATDHNDDDFRALWTAAWNIAKERALTL